MSNLKEVEDNLGFAVRAKVVYYYDWLGNMLAFLKGVAVGQVKGK